jgi:3-dehydroquinate dehydratase/shikimate dehydrogenase
MEQFAASQPTDPSTSPLAGRLFVVIGAGGAGKALAYGAKEKGARVVIANRTFGMHFGPFAAQILS